MKLFYTDSLGIYLPQQFAEDFYPHSKNEWNGISDNTWETILAGPDFENYWDAWNDILDNATCVLNDVEYRLHQDGDLWALSESDLVDECGNIHDANETPFATPETIEWNCENTAGFEDQIRAQEWLSLAEHYEGSLGDSLTYYGTPENKPIQWALKNYEALEFCFEHNPSWYCSGEQGSWNTFSDSWLSKDYNIEPNGFDGIYVTTLQGLEEIEVQAENGDCHCISEQGYFKVLARVAS